MRNRLSCLAAAAVFAAAAAPAAYAAPFALRTTYTTRVLSAAPLVLEYTLTATGAPSAQAFPAMALEGPATMVFAWKHSDAFLYSPEVVIAPRGDYAWQYTAFRSPIAEAVIASVSGSAVGDDPATFSYLDNGAGWHDMQTRFVVRFGPGVDNIDPADVNLQVVHFTTHGAPYIDVYRYAP
jgi:hypothetical protein